MSRDEKTMMMGMEGLPKSGGIAKGLQKSGGISKRCVIFILSACPRLMALASDA